MSSADRNSIGLGRNGEQNFSTKGNLPEPICCSCRLQCFVRAPPLTKPPYAWMWAGKYLKELLILEFAFELTTDITISNMCCQVIFTFKNRLCKSFNLCCLLSRLFPYQLEYDLTFWFFKNMSREHKIVKDPILIDTRSRPTCWRAVLTDVIPQVLTENFHAFGHGLYLTLDKIQKFVNMII